jgi:lipopolysaccharide heptosyltransferase II
VRTDRIGDVVLSLPMLPILKKHFPNSRISVLVRNYTKELVQRHPNVDEVLLWDEAKNWREYVSLLKKKKFDIAILPYPRFELAAIIFFAGIPVRVGTGYRWYSFFFNRKIYEHRKDAKRHEAEYNVNLLQAIGITNSEPLKFDYVVSENAKTKVENEFLKQGIKLNEPFAVLHPGSGGSARDWSLTNFALLANELYSTFHFQIIFTGGANEKELVQTVVNSVQVPSYSFVGTFNLEELAVVYSKAKVFISNSTGPLHIAAMMGTPVAAFYPPIIQCSPMRWGPYTMKKKIFVADNKQCSLCKGGVCQSNLCMEQITVQQVVAGVKELLNAQ